MTYFKLNWSLWSSTQCWFHLEWLWVGSYHKCAAACDFQQCGMCYQQSLRSACPYGQVWSEPLLVDKYSMTVKLLTKHHLEFLSLKGSCTGSSESALFKMPHCWKSRVTAQMLFKKNEAIPQLLLFWIPIILLIVFIWNFYPVRWRAKKSWNTRDALTFVFCKKERASLF